MPEASISYHRRSGSHHQRHLTAVLLATLLVATLAWSSPSGAASASAADAQLAGAIDKILADPRLDGAQSSVVVADAKSGERLYGHHPEDRLMPASNSKLLTSAAAIKVLGPDYTYTTDVRTHGGDLYLRGTGDPTLLEADYTDLAKQVARSGVTKVKGDLVADDTRFDDERHHWGWNVDDEQYYYGAPVSALTVAPDTDYDAGSVIVTVEPAEAPGKRPEVSIKPRSDHLTIRNEATTVSGDASGLTLERHHGQDTLTVSGEIGTDADAASRWRAVWDPTAHAAAVFRHALAQQGVTVKGGTRLGETVPKGGKVVASHTSMTVAELLNPFMKLSNNGHAEALIKTMGHQEHGTGSWSAGTRVVRETLADYGMDEATYVLADGSGLTRRNWIPAGQLADLLHGVQDEPWFDTWYEELPIACEPDRFTGGTLRSRMCDTPAARNAHAKTGTLTGATALSGYVRDADGRDLVFSVVLNYYMGSAPKDIEDQIVVALASGDPESAVRRSIPDSGITGDREADWAKPGAYR